MLDKTKNLISPKSKETTEKQEYRNVFTITSLEDFKEAKEEITKSKIMPKLMIFDLPEPKGIGAIDFSVGKIEIKTPMTLVFNNGDCDNINVSATERVYIRLAGNSTVRTIDCGTRTTVRLEDISRCWGIHGAKIICASGHSYFESFGGFSTHISLHENAHATIWSPNPIVTCTGTSTIHFMKEGGTIFLNGRSHAKIRASTNICANNESTVELHINMDNKKIVAKDFSRIFSRVKEENTPTIELYDNSSYYYYFDSVPKDNIKLHDNAIVKPVFEEKQKLNRYIKYNNIKTTPDGRLILYKAAEESFVVDNKTMIRSMWDRDFIYSIGSTIKPEKEFDDNKENECGSGIHLAPLPWVLNTYYNTMDLKNTIIKCFVNPDDILIPNDSDGKVRAREVYVDSIIDPIEELQKYFD